jgi:hypothetical protein
MNSPALSPHLEMVTAALKQVAREIAPVGSSAWRFTPRGEMHFSAVATLEDDWLVLESTGDLDLFSDASPWELLARNAALPGLAKFALGSGARIVLRAELPLYEDANLSARIRETCDGFESACLPYEFSEQDSDPKAPAARPDLKRLCAEAGWPFTERGPDKVLVELEAPPHFWQAAMLNTARGVHLSCDLAPCDSVSTECRDAIASFLLSASGVLRMARAAVKADTARLEVLFATPPSSSEISSSLDGLSVGCSLCGEEVKTLQDPAIAQHYFALRGGRSVALA